MTLNKRELKKQICLVCGELASQCIIAADNASEENARKWDELVIRIANLQFNSVKHCSFSFDKSARDFNDGKAYHKALHTYRKAAFNKLRADFNTEVNEIVKSMNTLLTPEEKAAQKVAANL